jgi:hypothetical protein
MRCFVANFIEAAGDEAFPETGVEPRSPAGAAPETYVVCDEEVLDSLRF